MRRDYIYISADLVDYDTHNHRAVFHRADQIAQARNEFFAFIGGYDGNPDYINPDGTGGYRDREALRHRDSLWEYFITWLSKVKVRASSRDHFWVDPDSEDAIWQEFLRLVPTIYLVICETYDRDPAKLDLIQRDPATGKETRVKRRVISKLPEITDGMTSIPDDSEPLSSDEREHGSIIRLVLGAYDRWPVPSTARTSPREDLSYLDESDSD